MKCGGRARGERPAAPSLSYRGALYILVPMGDIALPHRYPFLMVSPRAGTAAIRFSSNDARCRGGKVPAWAVAEAMAQFAGMAVAADGSSGGSLVQVNRFRCPRPLKAGGSMDLAASLVRRMGPLARVRVAARSGGRLVALSVLTLRLEEGA